MIKAKSRGFTLIELVVVMAIIAVLAALIVGGINVARNTATETADRTNGRTVKACLEAYYTKFHNYCGSTVSTPCDNGATFSQMAGRLSGADTGVQCNLSSSSVDGGGGAVDFTHPQVPNNVTIGQGVYGCIFTHSPTTDPCLETFNMP